MIDFFVSDDPGAVLSAIGDLQADSAGQITKPERFNARTGKPERGGLHCAKVFGPVEDFRCLCGFLTPERAPDAPGERCPKCGVECIERRVRDERWAHVESPVQLLHPALAPRIAHRLGCSPAELAKVVRWEANLNHDGSVVPMKKDAHGDLRFEDDAEEARQARGPAHVAARLGDEASALMPTAVPVTPAGWRENPRNACDAAYATLLNRCNRLQRLRELDAPAIILENEERQTQSAFDRVMRVLRAEIAARLSAPKTAPPEDRTAPLLQAIYDDPDDDAPRAVLADCLLEYNDPRGEFISLQLANAGARRMSRRESELLRRHSTSWLAPLDQAVEHEVFRRGFVVSCKTLRDGAAGLVGHPSWATVERIDTDLVDLVTHPVMRALREVRCNFKTFRQLCELSQPLDRIERAMVRMASCPPKGWQAAVDCVGLPALHQLTLLHQSSTGEARWEWLLDEHAPEHGLIKRLTQLTLGMAIERIEGFRLREWIERFDRFPTLSSLCLSLGKKRLLWTIERDGDGPGIAPCEAGKRRPEGTKRAERRHLIALGLQTSRGYLEMASLSDEPWFGYLAEAIDGVDPDCISRFDVRSDGGWWGDDAERLVDQLRQTFGDRASLPKVWE